jgi:protoporphyrinogen/coproporphyrinogen III oxidase
MMKVTENKRKVVIVGGGITGLTTAFYLQQQAQQNNLPLDVKLIESSLRVGGKIHTMRKDGYVIERGPESFFDTNNNVRNLAKDLGIEQKIMQNKNGRTYIAIGNDLHSVPSNVIFGGSPQITSFITSNLLSISGKVRAAGDFILPKANANIDETISEFFGRRFGKEAVENLVEPVLAGTFAGDVDHLSIHSMFPQLYQLEKDYRSVIVGMKKTGKGIYAIDDHHGALHYETFENGLETLISEIEQSLQPGVVMKGVKVDTIEQLKDQSLELHLNNGEIIKANTVIMTTPFNAAKAAFKDSEAMKQLPEMNYATIATVTMAFEEGYIKKNLDAMNFFVSRNSDYVITSCTWLNQKWENVAPKGYDLLRMYIGRVGDESIVELSDGEIEKTVLADLSRAFNLSAKPEFTVVSRWKDSMPQYTVGHDERLEIIKEKFQKEYPNVMLTGSSYSGISMPDCVAQGKRAAFESIESLFKEVLI